MMRLSDKISNTLYGASGVVNIDYHWIRDVALKTFIEFQ